MQDGPADVKEVDQQESRPCSVGPQLVTFTRRKRLRNALAAQLHKTVVMLATGYVLFCFSERMFWSFVRPGDSLGGLLLTWMVYSLLGWILLILVRRYRIASFPAVFMAGAVFGWLAEGVVVDTLYGSPSSPFPLSISFTGLAWHALLSVGVGWYLTAKALVAERPTRIIILSLAVGLGWGLWAAWWPNELREPGLTTLPRFAFHTLACSILLILAWFVLGRARPDWFRPRRFAAAFLTGLALILFLLARVPSRPMAVLVLPPLLALAFAGLRKHAGHEEQPDSLDALLGRVRTRNALALLLMPCAAIVAYAPFRLLDWHPATNVVVYLVTMPLGFWFFVQALWRRPALASRGAEQSLGGNP